MRLPILRPCSWSRLYALLALLPGIVLLSGSAAVVARPRGSAAEDREIARWIGLASADRSWLEKATWGLRQVEEGKSVVEGKRVAVRVDIGVSGNSKKKK